MVLEPCWVVWPPLGSPTGLSRACGELSICINMAAGGGYAHQNPRSRTQLMGYIIDTQTPEPE